ncbi:ATP-binding protein, partial [Kitasatospora sp. NPDC004240]
AALDGMPLAIELAAAQCSVLSLGQLAAHVEDRLALRGGERLGNPRHTTLRAAMAWSFALLTPAEREVLETLSVFEGGFGLEAAREITGEAGQGDAIGLVTHLVRLAAKSLLAASDDDPRRYRIAETVRHYAAEHADPDRLRRAGQRHLAWATRLADEAYEGLRGPAAREWTRVLAEETGNLRAALDTAARTGDADRALRIATGLSGFWYRRGQTTEGLRHLAPAVADRTGRPGVPDHALLARAAGGLALLQYLNGDGEAQLAALRKAGYHAALAEDPRTGAWVLAATAHAEALAGADGPAVRRAARALDQARAHGSPQLVAEVLLCVGDVELLAGRHDRAAGHLESALVTAEGCGYGLIASIARWQLAKTDLERGRPDRAAATAARLVELTCAESDTTFWLLGLATLAAALFRSGHHGRAAELDGAVRAHGARTGLAPELVDPDGLGRQLRRLRAGIEASLYARAAERGRTLTVDQVMELARADDAGGLDRRDGFGGLDNIGGLDSTGGPGGRVAGRSYAC